MKSAEKVNYHLRIKTHFKFRIYVKNETFPSSLAKSLHFILYVLKAG